VLQYRYYIILLIAGDKQMGVAAYGLLSISIVGCIAYGLIHWSKESTESPVDLNEKEQDKTAV
jgi:hypothetical protein